MSSKSKSSAFEASNNKTSSPAMSSVSKMNSRGGTFKSDADSHSPLQKPRLSVDQSPRSVTSKPVPDRRTAKASTTLDKQSTWILKGTELQAQLSAVQEDLKEARDKLALSEMGKARATEEAKEAKRLAEEANEKLIEALVAQKRAEEDSEIEKFRVVEIEQAGIETAQKNEEEWQKELESVRNQHALDLSALLSTTEELQRVQQELAITTDTKNQALTHADDATKFAEIHAEKMETLSVELAQVKASMEAKLEKEVNEKNEFISQLKAEVNSLKLELEKIKFYDEKLVEKEDCIDLLIVELEAAKMAESYTRNFAVERETKADALAVSLEEANRKETNVSESLELVIKQFKEKSCLLQNAEYDTSSLIEKVGLLELAVSRQREEIEDSEHQLNFAKDEAAEMAKNIESLKSELEMAKEKNIQALNNEKIVADSFQKLLEEKDELIKELESLSDENKKNKEAMESLTAVLHEVSTEARETKEKLLCSQAEIENYESEMKSLRFTLKSASDKYEALVGDAKQEIDILNKAIELSRDELLSLKEETVKKEHHFTDCVKQFEEERSSMEKEISRLTTLLKESDEKGCAMEEKGALVANTLQEVEAEVIHLKEILEDAKGVSMRSKENLIDKENELQCLVHENEELHNKEAVSLKKIEALSKLLEESMVRKQKDKNGEISDSEKDYDMLPKVVEFAEQNGDGREDKRKSEDDDTLSRDKFKNGRFKFENLNCNKDKKSKDDEGDSIEVTGNMWASCKIEENEFSTDKSTEQDSFDEGVRPKNETHESYDHINGLSSSETQESGENSPFEQRSQKKIKPLLKKFGNLLKKKPTNSQK